MGTPLDQHRARKPSCRRPVDRTGDDSQLTHLARHGGAELGQRLHEEDARLWQRRKRVAVAVDGEGEA
jgi:hypothetical protein